MNTEKLKRLYQSTSKHSNYQILPDSLKEYIDTDDLTIHSRFEYERMQFISSQLDFSGKKIVDIGGNTGYFSFQSITERANEVIYIEGNKEHAEFVRYAVEDLELNIKVYNKYVHFDGVYDFYQGTDIVLLFNVIHHLGDDFGDKSLSMEKAKEKMKASINYFYNKTKFLVLQKGFCWKGDRNLLLFEKGTKKEMIDFIKEATSENWDILTIGIAEEQNGETTFNLANENNIERNDSLGEFRNRPIFILKNR
jgi:hypothetical protein